MRCLIFSAALLQSPTAIQGKSETRYADNFFNVLIAFCDGLFIVRSFYKHP